MTKSDSSCYLLCNVCSYIMYIVPWISFVGTFPLRRTDCSCFSLVIVHYLHSSTILIHLIPCKSPTISTYLWWVRAELARAVPRAGAEGFPAKLGSWPLPFSSKKLQLGFSSKIEVPQLGNFSHRLGSAQLGKSQLELITRLPTRQEVYDMVHDCFRINLKEK